MFEGVGMGYLWSVGVACVVCKVDWLVLFGFVLLFCGVVSFGWVLFLGGGLWVWVLLVCAGGLGELRVLGL